MLFFVDVNIITNNISNVFFSFLCFQNYTLLLNVQKDNTYIIGLLFFDGCVILTLQ